MKLRNKVKLNLRRNKALERLEKQLTSKVKPERGLHPLTLATTSVNYLPLDKADVKRIEKEIATLKSKITQL